MTEVRKETTKRKMVEEQKERKSTEEQTEGKSTEEQTKSKVMEEEVRYTLTWTSFQENLVNSFKYLRNDKSLADVTLACEGKTCKANKVVLSACSPYFKALLKENPAKHPVIILKDVPFTHLEGILEYMYTGVVLVPIDNISAFFKSAKTLQVKGLIDKLVDNTPT